MSYFALIFVSVLIAVIMYITHIQDTNKELQRQKQNLQTKIIQEKVRSNIKEFQAYQKAKKEEITKHLKDKNEKRDINLSVGNHAIDF